MPLSSGLPDAPVIIYLHGFASSHRSTKATYFGERLRRHGLAFSCPDFNEPDFSTLTITRMLDRIAGEVERANEAAQLGPVPVGQPVVQDVKVEVPLTGQAPPIAEVASVDELIFREDELR